VVQMMRSDMDIFSREFTATSEPVEIVFIETYGGQSMASFVQSIRRPYEAETSQISQIAGVGTLKKPLSVSVNKDEGGYLVRCEELDITEAGANVPEALEAFCSFLREDLEHWRATDDANLTAEARALKHRYLDYVD